MSPATKIENPSLSGNGARLPADAAVLGTIAYPTNYGDRKRCRRAVVILFMMGSDVAEAVDSVSAVVADQDRPIRGLSTIDGSAFHLRPVF